MIEIILSTLAVIAVIVLVFVGLMYYRLRDMFK